MPKLPKIIVDQIKKYIVLSGFALLAIALCGCESVRYYSQAIQGQYSILERRQPISEIMADPESPEFLRDRLAHILAVRQFAENELQLPVKNHYLTYVDLNRPYVVWNVFAAPEFSLTAKTWCYPVVGCAAYRGYFSEKNARQYADGLTSQGYEVYVAGVTAYSTLGWFDDPVLSTIIQYSEGQSAALIFHELAHQVLYVKGDTAFNESFATAVEQEGLKRWQVNTQASHLYENHLRSYRRQQQFIQLIMHYRQILKTLYQSDASAMDKREQKASIFSELLDEFDRLKTDKNGLSVYDNWMNASLNNAKIGSVAAYHDFVPAFHKMLAENDGNLNQFYKACRELARGTQDERHRILNTYLKN
ncbi:PUTATIVE ZINC PROTEASE PROTEIN [Olavius sp. associated proteobacterium Delta 1]|nr:PUTATIVE ZINC PROTEASE PROTEIN [Olavius sp. associated proteobacterium Delta 1]